MGLFNFGKKKDEVTAGCCGGNCSTNPKADEKIEVGCSCGGTCGISDVKKAKFIVLGACCKKSQETFENAKQAVKEMGFTDEVLNIGDAIEIAKYGVMQTPALVIDSKVVSYGRLLKVEEIKKIIEKSNG